MASGGGGVGEKNTPSPLPTDGENVIQDPVASQQELLITEIESADGHLVNVLR